MEATIKLKDIFRMVRRRAVMIMSIVVSFSAVALLLAYFIPPTYIASAKILIVSQQIPGALARSTVTASASERLELIQQRLMTRSNLLGLIDRLDLYSERKDLSKTEKIALMRENTSLNKITVSDQKGVVAAFTISYKDNQAKRAALITNEFVTMVLEQNIRARSERASKTHDFFKEEVAQVETELARVEADLAEFKSNNELSMPESLEYRRREVDDIRKRRFERKAELLKLRQQQDIVAGALDSGRYAEATGEELSPQERDLQQLRNELTRARSLYTETHPTIRTLRNRIANMEDNLRAADPTAVLESAAERSSRIKGQLQRQLDALNTEIGLLEAAAERDDLREAQLVASIEETPEVAMELNARTRRLNDLKIRFSEAIRKQSFAATGEKLEVNRQAERFEVIEQAQVPERPTSPNRPAIAIGGFAGSVGFALGLAVLLGLLNPSIRTVGDMERKLEMRPLMTVPYIATTSERRRQRREIYLLLILVLVIIPVSLYAIDQYYLPLELLIDDFVERSRIREIIARGAELFNR